MQITEVRRALAAHTNQSATALRLLVPVDKLPVASASRAPIAPPAQAANVSAPTVAQTAWVALLDADTSESCDLFALHYYMLLTSTAE